MNIYASHQTADLDFARNLETIPLDDLIVECELCYRLLAACCNHDSLQGEHAEYTCHNCSLVMTDGACSNNGRFGATAGLGIVMDGLPEFRWSIPVDDSIDDDAPRTSQRAELLAALEGLTKLGDEERNQGSWQTHARSQTEDHVDVQSPPTLVVVTDSEYVVKGMTQWFPNWRNNGWCNSQGRRPANLDLFFKLDDLVAELEQSGFDVGFWHIPREYNHRADQLAKDAARY